MASEELQELGSKIADWAHPELIVYVFGSRVRGDHAPNSDVDIHFGLPSNPSREFTLWWTGQHNQDFSDLKKVLPGPLRILERDAPLCPEIEGGRVVHECRMLDAFFYQRSLRRYLATKCKRGSGTRAGCSSSHSWRRASFTLACSREGYAPSLACSIAAAASVTINCIPEI
jgi:Nucleotidyltransferase domain